MLISRRIKEQVAAHAWFAVWVEFFIVVVGILLAFQITEWADARADRVREGQIIADLLADLEIDRSQYAAGLTADEFRVSAANASLTGAGLPAIEFDWAASATDRVDYSFDVLGVSEFPPDRLDRLWSDIVLGYHPTPSTSTYDTMVGAGETRLLRNRGIMRQIQLYQNLTSSVAQQNDKIMAIRQDVMNIGAAAGLAPYLSVPVEEYLRLVAADPQVASAIRIMATFAIYHHGEIKAADARAAELQVLLSEYLGG